MKTYYLWLYQQFMITFEIDGNIDRLNHETVELEYIIFKNVRLEISLQKFKKVSSLIYLS